MEKERITHYISANDNVYYIMIGDTIVFSIELDKVLNHVIIRTPNEVYAGPVDLIYFKEDLKDSKKYL